MEDNTLNEDNFVINQAKLLGSIDKILIKRSIAKRVSDSQPMKGPSGIISGANWSRENSKLTVSVAEVTAETEKIRTEFTVEALQDLKALHGEDFYSFLAHYLIDDLSYTIDKDFIDMIKTRAQTKTHLVFGSDFDKDLLSVGQSIAIRVNKGLSDLPISDNRAPTGWAVVSSNIASILSITSTVDVDNVVDDSPSYIGMLAGVEYYIDYTHANDGVDSVVFGIKGNGYSKGSTIYSHYSTRMYDVVDNNGEGVFFLINRKGMTINPLDKEYYNGGVGVSGFLGKFDVDLSGLQVIKDL